VVGSLGCCVFRRRRSRSRTRSRSGSRYFV